MHFFEKRFVSNHVFVVVVVVVDGWMVGVVGFQHVLGLLGVASPKLCCSFESSRKKRRMMSRAKRPTSSSFIVVDTNLSCRVSRDCNDKNL